MFLFGKKRSETASTHESIVAGLVELLGSDLIMAVEYGREPSLKKLTGCEPVLFLIIADTARERISEIQQKITSPVTTTAFVVTETEASLLPLLFPLELIHIRSGYSLLYGEERMLHVEISRDPVITQLLRELLSLSLQIRAEVIKSYDVSNVVSVNILRRMISVVKGLLSLRQTTIPVDWASLVSDLESAYNVKQFPLSGMVATLEKNRDASLNEFLVPLLQVIDDLRTQLVIGDGSNA